MIPGDPHLQPYIANLAQRVLDGNLLTRPEAESLVRTSGEDIHDLFYWANKIRIKFMGKDVTASVTISCEM